MDVALAPTDKGIDLAELPAASHFEGYQAEMAVLEAHWRDGAPVVTIVGEGGIGKTALAVEAARRFHGRFPGGVLGLSLDPIPESPALLSRLVGWVWGTVPDARWDERRLLNEAAYTLREQERLLVLDGYEGVVRAAAPDSDSDTPAVKTVRRLVRRLLGGKTRLLLTNHEPTSVPGEQTVRLDGLDPQDGAALFRALTPGKRWDGDVETGTYADEDALRDLSREVRGHPLALELLAGAYAAGRESLEEFRERLAERLQAARLAHLGRPHHATLAACLGVSLDGLAPEPRALLPRLTLFQAPFLGGIAAAVFDDEAVPDHLHSLARANLAQPLEVAAAGERATLYRLHPAVRVLVEPKVDPVKLEAPRLRFVAAYTFFTATALQRFTTLGSRLVRFFVPDLYRALEWAERDDWSGLAFNLAGLWGHYGLLDEAMRLYRDVLAIHDAQGDQQGKGATLAMIGQLLARRDEHQEALHAFLDSLSTFVQIQAAPDAAKVAQVITDLRRRVGPIRFQALWTEVAGGEPLPDWLTGGAP